MEAAEIWEDSHKSKAAEVDSFMQMLDFGLVQDKDSSVMQPRASKLKMQANLLAGA